MYYPIDDQWKKGIYLKAIEDFNSANFKIIPWTGPWLGWDATIYITDGKSVYFGHTKVSHADPASFRTFDGTYYSKDKKNAYYLGNYCEKTPECSQDGSNYRKVSWADPLSFSDIWWLVYEYAIDKNRAYVNGRAIRWADVETFEFVWSEGIWGDFAKDKDHVYAQDTVFEGDVDPATFSMKESGEIRDKDYPEGW